MAAPEGALPKTFSVSADKPLALPDELSYIISAFQPSEPHTSRSKAILVLSAFCQGVRSSFGGGQKPVSDNVLTESLGKIFLPLLSAKLADTTTEGYVVTASFLSSLFQVDWQSAAYIFQQDGVIDYITDAIDIFPSQDAYLETSRLLSQAAGHKTCRSLITEDLVQWLETSCRSSNPDLRASSAIAVVKLSRGQSSDSSETTARKRISPLSPMQWRAWHISVPILLLKSTFQKTGTSSLNSFPLFPSARTHHPHNCLA